MMQQPATTTILAALATALPPSSFVASIEAHANHLDLTIDTHDADAAQAALRGDPLFAQLRLQGATPGEDGRSELRLLGPMALHPGMRR